MSTRVSINQRISDRDSELENLDEGMKTRRRSPEKYYVPSADQNENVHMSIDKLANQRP